MKIKSFIKDDNEVRRLHASLRIPEFVKPKPSKAQAPPAGPDLTNLCRPTSTTDFEATTNQATTKHKVSWYAFKKNRLAWELTQYPFPPPHTFKKEKRR